MELFFFLKDLLKKMFNVLYVINNLMDMIVQIYVNNVVIWLVINVFKY